ncbi:MAG: hypothetical protein ACI81V_000967 [Lentimonas sp.]
MSAGAICFSFLVFGWFGFKFLQRQVLRPLQLVAELFPARNESLSSGDEIDELELRVRPFLSEMDFAYKDRDDSLYAFEQHAIVATTDYLCQSQFLQDLRIPKCGVDRAGSPDD